MLDIGVYDVAVGCNYDIICAWVFYNLENSILIAM